MLTRSRIRSPGSCPTSAETTTSSSEHSTEYVTADNLAQDNLNGTFSFGTSNAPFNPNNPRTYPDRLTIRVPGQGFVAQKAHYVSFFAQDKWKMTNRLTATLGRALRRRDHSGAGAQQPGFCQRGRLPGRQEQHSAAGRSRIHARRCGAFGRCGVDTAGSTTRRTLRSSTASSTPESSRTPSP